LIVARTGEARTARPLHATAYIADMLDRSAIHLKLGSLEVFKKLVEVYRAIVADLHVALRYTIVDSTRFMQS
jgi:hypothetical protein